jgi:hypothetical protein
MLQERKCGRVMMNKIAKNIWKNYAVECTDIDGASRGISILWGLGCMEVKVTSELPRLLMVRF